MKNLLYIAIWIAVASSCSPEQPEEQSEAIPGSAASGRDSADPGNIVMDTAYTSMDSATIVFRLDTTNVDDSDI